MSWNIFIFKSSADNEQLSIGSVNKVWDALNTTFASLNWASGAECGLCMDRKFNLQLDIVDGHVNSIMTDGGYDHLAQFAKLASDQGWVILDPHLGININLDSPYSIYDDVG